MLKRSCCMDMPHAPCRAHVLPCLMLMQHGREHGRSMKASVIRSIPCSMGGPVGGTFHLIPCVKNHAPCSIRSCLRPCCFPSRMGTARSLAGVAVGMEGPVKSRGRTMREEARSLKGEPPCRGRSMNYMEHVKHMKWTGGSPRLRGWMFIPEISLILSLLGLILLAISNRHRVHYEESA